MWWVVAVVSAVVSVSTYLTWTAARVDRLHAKAAAANAALDAHLVRRAAAALALAEATQLIALACAGRIALEARPEDREMAENDLTRQLRTVLFVSVDRPAGGDGLPSDPPAIAPLVAAPPAIAPVVAANRRVALARQVHNDMVRDALAMRRRLWVRAFRLARNHPRPAYFDIDDPVLTEPEAITP